MKNAIIEARAPRILRSLRFEWMNHPLLAAWVPQRAIPKTVPCADDGIGKAESSTQY